MRIHRAEGLYAAVLMPLALLVLTLPSGAEVWYVDKDNVSGVEDGLSWPTAYTTIQAALDAAYEMYAADPATPAEVWVAEGVYDEPRVSILDVDTRDTAEVPVNTGSLLLRPGIALYGGFAGDESKREMRPEPLLETVIDGSTSRDDAPAIHVVVGAEKATLDGFVVRGGDSGGAHEFTQAKFAYDGSGLRTGETLSLTVRMCTFSDLAGWAVYAPYGSEVLVDECVFPGTDLFVGGDCDIRNCVFTGAGTGVSITGSSGSERRDISVRITGCRFEDHQRGDSSALQVRGANPVISDCVFVGNHAVSETRSGTGRGGAISFIDSPAKVINCLFYNNTAESGGAVGISTSYGNWTLRWGPWVTFINCTFARNTALGNGGAVCLGSAVFRNCIFWDNRPNTIEVLSYRPTRVDYSLIPGGWTSSYPQLTGPSVRNFESDPRFVNPDAGDFRLQPNSPAIDTGILDGTLPWDLDGNPRPQGARVDLGAYESPYWHAPDVTDDGQVNARDIQAVVNAILGIPTPYTTDVDGDGVTDAKDLQKVINAVLGV